MNKKRIGLFGGTFNPIHNGHLFIAECAKTYLNLDQLMFIPTKIPPHKRLEDNSVHRANMVDIAILNTSFSMSTVELLRDGPSYTIDTLEHFSRELSDTDLFFIMGKDSFDSLLLWKHYSKIFNYKLVVVSRWDKGVHTFNTSGNRSVCEIDFQRVNNKEYIDKCCESNIITIDPPLMNISSTKIRQLIKIGLSVRYLLPDNVINYINNHNLYREN